jgi:hypothetical protein
VAMCNRKLVLNVLKFIRKVVCKIDLTSYTTTLCLMESKLSRKKPKSSSESEYFG